MNISGSVGYGGVNNPADVKLVQQLLNANQSRVPTMTTSLVPDGKSGRKTRTAIVQFQQNVLGFNDGRVDPGGQTFSALKLGGQGFVGPNSGPQTSAGASQPPSFYGGGSGDPFDFSSTISTLPAEVPLGEQFFSYPYFFHDGHEGVTLNYVGPSARKMNGTAETLLKCILASVGIHRANLNSTRRTYHDQARITLTQTYKKRKHAINEWYGSTVAAQAENFINPLDIQGFADWWEAHDSNRGRVSSKHLSNQALDVDPGHSRGKFAEKVKSLVDVGGAGVRKIIPKGVLSEPVDHVEFHFKICPV